MFDISVLKGMKLTELQDIAKSKSLKFAGVKKESVIAMILENQSSSNNTAPTDDAENKPKRARIIADKKPEIEKSQAFLFLLDASINLTL